MHTRYAVEQTETMSPAPPSIDAAPLHALVSSFAPERHCPTLVWGVIVDGRLAATGTVGDVAHRTVYRIASMTKSFSAAATLQLRDAGVLRLDDRASDHARELRALDRFDAAPITIRDLLAMTSGLPTDDPWADRHLDLTDERFDRIITDGPVFARSTGDSFEYSNFGYAILGRVVHRATGHRIQETSRSDCWGRSASGRRRGRSPTTTNGPARNAGSTERAGPRVATSTNTIRSVTA